MLKRIMNFFKKRILVSGEAMKAFFPLGRMLSHSKSGYCSSHPNSHPVFNGNICTSDGVKIWYGDIDLVHDSKKLKMFAEDVGDTLYVLSEHDARFANELKPKMENAIATVTYDTITILRK